MDVSSAPGPPHEAEQNPSRATHWQLLRDRLHFPRSPLIMGIVNVTPDSFSDGGQFLDPARAVARGLQLAAEGAVVLDVGGESTRPGAEPVEAVEQLRRVLPVIQGLANQTSVPISIDTTRAQVARQALDQGAQIINDVTGFEGDPEMPEVARKTKAGVCVMHMQGTPQNMQHNPVYQDVLDEVCQYLSRRRDTLEQAGIDAERICLDPGLGFGKRYAHNLALLEGGRRLLQLGCPVLVGHSRKGFLGKLIGDPLADRTPANLGVALALANQGVHLLRVHDVAPLAQALAAFQAAGGWLN